MGKDARVFNFILLFAVMHVVMDMVTLYTVNNQDTVPLVVNKIAHSVFYLSAILYSYVICLYTLRMSRPREMNRKKRAIALIPVLIYANIIIFSLSTHNVKKKTGRNRAGL